MDPFIGLSSFCSLIELSSEDIIKLMKSSDVDTSTVESVKKHALKNAFEWKGDKQIKMGCFPQTRSGKSLPITWNILKIADDKMMCISEKILNAFPYAITDGNWYESDIRKWLNEVFYKQAFSAEEQKAVMPVVLGRIGMVSDYSDEVPPVHDRVFLLSTAECESLIPENHLRVATASMYAIHEGVCVGEKENYAPWWCRDKGRYTQTSAYIDTEGHLNKDGIHSTSTFVGIRPVIWLEIFS